MWHKGMVALEFLTTKSIHTTEYHFSLWRFIRLIPDREWWDSLRPLTERSGGLVAGHDHANNAVLPLEWRDGATRSGVNFSSCRGSGFSRVQCTKFIVAFII